MNRRITNIPEPKFNERRAAVVKAIDDLTAMRIAIELKYGRTIHASKREQGALDRLSRRRERESDRMFKLLDASPRNWRVGVPEHWVLTKLTYADAIRPETEPLSVQPPKAFGAP